MTKWNTLLRDQRGATLMTFAIVGGLMAMIWIEMSKITGISVIDMVEIAAYNLGLR